MLVFNPVAIEYRKSNVASPIVEVQYLYKSNSPIFFSQPDTQIFAKCKAYSWCFKANFSSILQTNVL